MATPVNTISNVTDIPVGGVGVYILDAGPTRSIRGNLSQTVGYVITAEWGPAEVWYEPLSANDLVERHWPFGPTGGFYGISNLPKVRAKFWRVLGTSPVKSTKTFQDGAGSPADSLEVTAKYYGTDGDKIKITITANADDSDARDVRVYMQDPATGVIAHDETYVALQADDGTVTDPGDPYVTFTKASGATLAAAVAAGVSLAGGSSGTIAATDFADAFTAAGSPVNGIDILCPVEPASSILAATNAALYTFATSAAGRNILCYGCSPASEAAGTALTTVASYRSVYLNFYYPWRRVQRRVFYSYRGTATSVTQTLCGGPLLAAMRAKLVPGDAAMMSTVAEWNSSVVGLDTGATDVDESGYATLAAAGITAWYYNDEFGYVPYNDVCTYLVNSVPIAGDLKPYKVYASDAIAQYMAGFLGKPLDLDLGTETLGPVTRAQIGAIRKFLKAETTAGRIIGGQNSDGSTSPAWSVDPFSLATSDNLADGRWDVSIQARKTPRQRQNVLYTQIDLSVDIRN